MATSLPSAGGGALAAKGSRRKRGHSQGDGPKLAHAQGSTLSATLKRFKAYDESKIEICEKCGESSGLNSMIQCESCERFHHLKCCGIAPSYHDTARDLLHLAGWSCRDCRIGRNEKTLAMETALTDLTRQLDQMKAELKQKNKENENATTNSPEAQPPSFLTVSAEKGGGGTKVAGHPVQTPLTKAQVAKIVTRTISDQTRRKKNVIVSGIPESANNDDQRAFLSVCEEHLSTKPALSHLGVKRLGNLTEGATRHRPLLVHLESENAAKEILRSAKSLRSSSDKYVATNIFINPDLTVAEQKTAYDKRVQRRLQGSGETAVNSQSAAAGFPPNATAEFHMSNTARVVVSASSATATSTSNSTPHHVPNNQLGPFPRMQESINQPSVSNATYPGIGAEAAMVFPISRPGYQQDSWPSSSAPPPHTKNVPQPAGEATLRHLPHSLPSHIQFPNYGLHAQSASNQLNPNVYELHVPSSYYSIPQTHCQSLDAATTRQIPVVSHLNHLDYPPLPQPSLPSQPFRPNSQPNPQLYPQHTPQSLPATSPWPLERTM